jgi:CubicO group peptidase (beta-lactamase class C family)
VLSTGAALPLALAWPRAARSEPPPIVVALQERLLTEGVGYAAVQVGPQGMSVHTVGRMQADLPGPITERSVFELGSMTKAFVALLLADGVLRGRWTLDDPVEDGLPADLPLRDVDGRPLRLIDLATHRSGLPRMPTNIGPKELPNPYPGYTEERMFAFLRGWRPEVSRGQRFEYSNLGYGLLSRVLARREQRSLDDLLAERVFAPLGISGIAVRRPLPAGDDLGVLAAALQGRLAGQAERAVGHAAGRKPVGPWEFDAMAGAVGLEGTIGAVGRFVEAAVGGFEHPLQPAFALCLQPRVEGEHALHPFGLAWEVSTIVSRAGTRQFFNQDGATAGFSSTLWIEPARGRGAAVLANAFVETRELGLLALDPALREDQFNRMLLAPEALAPLAGRYQLDARYALDIRARDGRLFAQGTGQREFELLPRTPRSFFVRHGELVIDFDATERPGTLTVLRAGRGLLFTRVP